MTLATGGVAKLPTLDDIAYALGGQVVVGGFNGDRTKGCIQSIQSIASLDLAQEGDISFIASDKLMQKLHTTRASFLVLPPSLQAMGLQRLQQDGSTLLGLIITEKPYLYYAQLTQWWVHKVIRPLRGFIHPSAVIDPSARIDASATIGALCVVEAHAVVGAHTVLKANVTLGERCEMGTHCVVHSGAVIGSDGFGFANEVGNGYNPGGAWVKIEQLGRVLIGNHVEIGANVCIDRGALTDTVLEDGVKLDNLVHIAHGVRLGRNTAVAASAIFAGGVQVGENCTFGGAARIKGHTKIADNVHISADTSVIGDVPAPGQYTGMFPMLPHAEWMKNAALLGQLTGLRKRIQELEKMNGK